MSNACCPKALIGRGWAFLADLGTHRDRAMVLLMLLGGLRAAEVRGLLLPEVDMGRRQVRVVGKGGRERVVPVDRPFFAELASYFGKSARLIALLSSASSCCAGRPRGSR